ncbi:MAG: nitrogen fixation protein NifM [Hyphomicrobiales bacterium]|nr:MAG: nitrogen fixation protein NifM [Hyphomicrobiales bacterium]
MSESIKTASIHAHHLMRASLSLFEKCFDELTDEEKWLARQEAQKSSEIEALILASPEAAGVIITPEMLDQTMAEVQSRYDGRKAFKQDLKRNGLKIKDLRHALERELMVEAVLEKVAASAPTASDADIRAWYDRHPQKFQRPETRTVRHILITINEDIPENQRETALATINDIHAKCNGASDQFQNLALIHSECPSALEGGLLGRVPRGKLYTALDKALFNMDEGTTSPVLETETGFHILYCEKIHPSDIVGYDEAAPQIKQAMDKKLRQKSQTLWLSALMKNQQVSQGHSCPTSEHLRQDAL